MINLVSQRTAYQHEVLMHRQCGANTGLIMTNTGLIGKRIILYLFCIMTFACAEKTPNLPGDGNPGTSATDFVSFPSDSASGQGGEDNILKLSEIQGIWYGPCEQGAVEYVQRHLKIEESRFRQENQFHPDADCVIKTRPPFVIAGTYVIGGDITTSGGILAKEIDFIVDAADTDAGIRLPDIVYISNNVMYFGVEQTTNARPEKIDFNFAYLK